MQRTMFAKLTLVYYDQLGGKIKEVGEDSPEVEKRVPSSWERAVYEFPEITIAITPLRNGAKKVLIAKFEYDGKVDIIYGDELLFAKATKETLGQQRIATSGMRLGAPEEKKEIPVLQVSYLTPSMAVPHKQLQVRNSEDDPEFCKVVKLTDKEFTYNFCCSEKATPLEKYWNSPLVWIEIVGPYRYRARVQEFRNPGIIGIVGIRGDSREYFLIGTYGFEHRLGEQKEVFVESQSSPGRLTARA